MVGDRLIGYTSGRSEEVRVGDEAPREFDFALDRFDPGGTDRFDIMRDGLERRIVVSPVSVPGGLATTIVARPGHRLDFFDY